jgi:hypothetical protein
MSKTLILTITFYVLTIFVLNMTQPENLYKLNKQKVKEPISFGFGHNKQIVCMQTICLILPLFLYLILTILS